MKTSRILDVVALILIKQDEVLIAQRPKNDRLGLKWEFPGGKIEEGETPEVALKREIREELEIEIKVTNHFMTNEYNKPPVPIRLHAYLAELESGEPLSKVHEQVLWVPIEHLESLDFAPADLPLVRRLLNPRER
jgi:8-oxo-dGTP diphosphatase